ncbi:MULTISPECIES: alpha/beta hydrolase family protein [Aequorivita]|uniref:Alpha/beta hydrolase fold domain-containing protein n=1 Tax=Aequorivita iocasae TaxID=2803865 RepID=A0ABX7DVQ1_9FLAO|nr:MULTISPECIES: alpha/beta fold hydrolase [Aequorivita]QQX77716.1 alpha/beta hydrolase fold domain-containing protein [Aequorivita iocasae]UCA57216.1 alpha/beta hydrolase [Aequorivita sp. F7]
MIINKNRILSTENKKPILYDVYYTETDKPQPLVVFCHGYKGFKDWGAWHLVAKAFAEAGFCFVKFNFSHNGGTMEQPIDFPDLEAFADNNFSLELDDLDRVLNEIEKGNENLPKQISTISLIGHSRGGGIVLIKANEDSRIDKAVTWASVSDFKARFQENTPEFETWKETGVTHVENSRTKQMLPHKFQFYKDFKENEERFSIKRAVKNLKIPQLIVHGSEDPTVSEKEARAIHSWNPESELKIIEGADHVFNAKHPWEENSLPQNLEKTVAETIEFIK